MGALPQFKPEEPGQSSYHFPLPQPRKRGPRLKVILWLVLLLLILGTGFALYYESQTSIFQSREISRYAQTLTYQLEPGPSDSIRFPVQGPFDERLGYTRIPRFLELLEKRGMVIEQQTRFSQALLEYIDYGLFAPYHEKTQAGLNIQDCRGEQVYNFRYPRRGYVSYGAVPERVAQALLFIENRDLLDTQRPLMNPAVDWERFTKAVFLQVAEEVGMKVPSMGGSTLATQIEKYRHSAEGVTSSAQEKLRQMASASVRAYQWGPQTLPVRRDLVLSYLNTVPLSAAPGYGEVNGLGDGLFVWFNADFDEVNQLLAAPDGQGETLHRQGMALRQVIALMIAHRRPSYYLAAGRDELQELTDSYLRIMANAGAISTTLRDAALSLKTQFRDFIKLPAVAPMVTNKGLNAVRTRLAGTLEVPLYELDRLDLSATTTLQQDLQDQVTAYLHRVRDPAYAAEVGLIGERLLTPEQANDLRYSFTLFERTPDANRVRVQTDNTDKAFDINEGSKLELGSTAKLRVLATYLEIIAELHQTYSSLEPKELEKVEVDPLDALSGWTLNYLRTAEDKSLQAILNAALERQYSASPAEAFFTGGGMHTFNNFRKEDNNRIATVRESLRESLNLPFVRILRDIVRYTTIRSLADKRQLLSDDKDPRREEYLRRFADREGVTFLNRFWRKYQGKTNPERLDTFLDGLRQTPVRLAAVHRYLFPNAEVAELASFLRGQLPDDALSDKRINDLYRSYGPGAYNLPDQGYIARVHPLELWLVGYLQQHPDATYTEIVESSEKQRQEVYNWLFRTRAKNARDSRIRSMLEVEAFLDIHQRWKRYGYPFDHLVPSLATALGSSGDRPAALAELMGIILNDGKRLPSVRINDLHFAKDTPYQTDLQRAEVVGEQAMRPEVAATLKAALSEVVNNGTARRIQGAYVLPDGTPLPMGGKTGTGDNRLVSIGPGGQRISSRALSRTATFVFYLGNHHFGTLTAFVPGQEAAEFHFTSALPVQVLKGMAPILQAYLDPAGPGICGALSSADPQAQTPQDVPSSAP